MSVYCTSVTSRRLNRMHCQHVTTLHADVGRLGDSTLIYYSDVIMGAMAFQITGVSIVCLAVCSDAGQRKHQSSALLAFVRGIHRSPMDSPSQRAGNAESVSIWWRHHGNGQVGNCGSDNDESMPAAAQHYLSVIAVTNKCSNQVWV